MDACPSDPSLDPPSIGSPLLARRFLFRLVIVSMNLLFPSAPFPPCSWPLFSRLSSSDSFSMASLSSSLSSFSSLLLHPLRLRKASPPFPFTPFTPFPLPPRRKMAKSASAGAARKTSTSAGLTRVVSVLGDLSCTKNFRLLRHHWAPCKLNIATAPDTAFTFQIFITDSLSRSTSRNNESRVGRPGNRGLRTPPSGRAKDASRAQSWSPGLSDTYTPPPLMTRARACISPAACLDWNMSQSG
mmetsp:Transcript_12251/g.21949  ORF Transcript_12251/g.21949 Transcript_12251/m.21949 type:complete len:243 (+) Transcript_12251:830-1558(+)